jgi:glycosyltransferase involved in cell wall biosynthesis
VHYLNALPQATWNCYAGYELFERKFWPEDTKMPRLSVIIPVFNEAPALREVLDMLLNTPCPIEREWILVDDCSTDGSRQVLEDVARRYHVKTVFLPENRGKGAAIRSGLAHVTGDLLMIQDADFEYDPRDIPDLLVPLLAERADVVYGSRFKQSVTQVHRTYHYFVNRFLTFWSNLLSGIYVTDMETCYKIFRADLVKAMRLRSDRFGIEIELTAYIAKTSARIFELPIHYYPRTYLQGKKINWKDGVAALFHLVRFNLFVSREEAFELLPRNYFPQRQRKLRAVPARS